MTTLEAGRRAFESYARAVVVRDAMDAYIAANPDADDRSFAERVRTEARETVARLTD